MLGGRLKIIAAGFLLAVIVIGLGAVWFDSTLRASWRRGFAAGSADMQQKHQRTAEKFRRAARKLELKSGNNIRLLEKAKDELQKRLEAVSRITNQKGAGTDDCLGPDLLRALSRTGHDCTDPASCP